MEKFPSSPNQPGWQDITFEMIESKIKENNFKDALVLCNIRKEALEEALDDVSKNISEHQSGVPLEQKYEINATTWEKDQKIMQEEIDQLNKYITDIQQKQKSNR